MENGILKKKLKLEGMSCTACETKIENKLKKLAGVLEVEASYATSIVTITYDENKITLDEIIKAIEKLDYTVINVEFTKRDSVNRTNNDFSDAKSSTEKGSYNQLIIIGIIIFGIYMIIKNSIGFNFIPEITPNMGFGILFVVGLLSSLHCVAMCGGINLSLCVSYKFDQTDNNKFLKFLPSLMYNTGRVISYTIIGGIVGALGSVFSISNTGSAVISILAGAFMVIMGLNMLNIFPWLRKINPHMPKIFAKKIYKEKNNKGPFVVGLLNGLMPCGPLQAMQLYALGTGSFIAGALSMFMFSLGTVPLLFAFGALGSMLSAKFTKKMIKVSGMLVILLGFIMVNRGIAFTGFTFNTPIVGASASNTNENVAAVNGEVQEITTTLESGKYTPITVQAGVPVKWTIVADSNSLNGCNNEIIIPKFDVKQKLQEGENVITFTPQETGKFGYSCWMGMIRSNITVTDDLKNTDAINESESSGEVDNSGLPAGCCGG